MRHSFPLTLLVLLYAMIAFARPHSDLATTIAKSIEGGFKDPAYLYLIFKDKSGRGDSVTWLHPDHHRSNWCQEMFMPGHEQEAHAFSFKLVRVTPKDYEVSFQPIEPVKPWLQRPLLSKDVRLFFPRSKRKSFALTEKLSVEGFYGDPRFKP